MTLTILQKVLGVIQDGKTVPLHCCTFASLNSGVCAVDCQHQGIFIGGGISFLPCVFVPIEWVVASCGLIVSSDWSPSRRGLDVKDRFGMSLDNIVSDFLIGCSCRSKIN